MKRTLILILTGCILLSETIISCQRAIYQLANPVTKDEKYDTEYPQQNLSKALQSILGTIYSLNSVAYYSGFVFTGDSKVTLQDIRSNSYADKAVQKLIYNTSVLGTATVLYSSYRQVVLLTCAHVLSFPDTSIRYYREEGSQNPTDYIQSVAFKLRQHNFIPEFSEVEDQNMEILAMDPRNDLALVGGTFISDTHREISVFPYPFGTTKDLQWGSRVFIAGFPKGKKMVTSGMVSQPHQENTRKFLVDALFNRGMSGGAVVAIRDGLPNVELVGLASSASGDYTYLLSPEEDWETTDYDPRLPYGGDSYVNLQKKIDYGITYVVPVDSIQSFIRVNNSTILGKGYDLRSLIKDDPKK